MDFYFMLHFIKFKNEDVVFEISAVTENETIDVYMENDNSVVGIELDYHHVLQLHIFLTRQLKNFNNS